MPRAKHKVYESCVRRDERGFDPLFRLNHTCAKLRADIARLRYLGFSPCTRAARTHQVYRIAAARGPQLNTIILVIEQQGV